MKNWPRDIRYTFRMLGRNKAFSAIAVLALALGIGPNTAIFSVVWATLLAPLPNPEPDRMVVVWLQIKGERNAMPSDLFARYLQDSHSFQAACFGAWDTLHLTLPGETEPIKGGFETPGWSSVSGLKDIAIGREFSLQDAQPGRDHVVVLRHQLWTGRLGSDPAIVGKQVKINGESFTVIGVFKPGPFDKLDSKFTVPLTLLPGPEHRKWGQIMVRLKRGVSMAQTQAELTAITKRFLANEKDVPKDWAISVEQFKNDWLSKSLERNLWLLLATVGFVLLMACANVANLLLARGTARQKEIAVRCSIGASRGQVVTQLITESLTLAGLGCALGIAMGWGLMKAMLAMLPTNTLPAEADVRLNLPVLAFTVAASLLAGLLFGCAPAWQAAQLDLTESLKQGSRSVLGGHRMRLQGTLVTTEFALAITLLAGAGLAIHSFWNLNHVDLGVRTDHILAAELNPPAKHYAGREQINQAGRRLLDRLKSIPGVQNAALSWGVPLTGSNSFPFAIAGQPVADQSNRPIADFFAVSPSYFDVFRVRLLSGRFMTESDDLHTAPVVMVSESFVRRFLPHVNPLTQNLLIPELIPYSNQLGRPIPHQIIGVFHDIRHGDNLADKPLPTIYAPFWQYSFPGAAIVVRTAVNPLAISSALRSAVHEVAPTQNLTQLQSMDQIVSAHLVQDRFGAVLFGLFAAVALLLAAVGIYGVMAFAVAQRTHEIGLRMALGAQRFDVTNLVLGQGMRRAGLGLGIGLGGAYVLGRLMQSTLYRTAAFDLTSLAAVVLVLLASAFIASYVPARRATKVDPMIALRQE